MSLFKSWSFSPIGIWEILLDHGGNLLVAAGLLLLIGVTVRRQSRTGRDLRFFLAALWLGAFREFALDWFLSLIFTYLPFSGVYSSDAIFNVPFIELAVEAVLLVTEAAMWYCVYRAAFPKLETIHAVADDASAASAES